MAGAGCQSPAEGERHECAHARGGRQSPDREGRKRSARRVGWLGVLEPEQDEEGVFGKRQLVIWHQNPGKVGRLTTHGTSFAVG